MNSNTMRCRNEGGKTEVNTFEQSKQNIGMNGTFVGLVEDDNIVFRQHPIDHGLAQQHAVGEKLDARVLRRHVVKANAITDFVAERHAAFLAHPLGDSHGGHATGLRDGEAVRDKTRLQQVLRQLG
jgi:hypothetical protein